MKPRARDLNIRIGQLQPGPLNAITDVPGVRVGHCDVRGRSAAGRDIYTGVTLIEPRPGSAGQQPCFAGVHVLNGNGDATGLVLYPHAAQAGEFDGDQAARQGTGRLTEPLERGLRTL